MGGDVALILQSLASACHPLAAMNPTGSHMLVARLKAAPEIVGKHSCPANSGRPSIELQHVSGETIVKHPVPGSTARGGGDGGGVVGSAAGGGFGAAPGGIGGGAGGESSQLERAPSTVT